MSAEHNRLTNSVSILTPRQSRSTNSRPTPISALRHSMPRRNLDRLQSSIARSNAGTDLAQRPSRKNVTLKLFGDGSGCELRLMACCRHGRASRSRRGIVRFDRYRTANLGNRLDPSGAVAILTGRLVENETSIEPSSSGESAATDWVLA